MLYAGHHLGEPGENLFPTYTARGVRPDLLVTGHPSLLHGTNHSLTCTFPSGPAIFKNADSLQSSTPLSGAASEGTNKLSTRAHAPGEVGRNLARGDSLIDASTQGS